MAKIDFLFITLVIALYSINGCICEDVNPSVTSGCLNPLFVDKPVTINDCASKKRFVNQVLQNYDRMYRKFLLISDDCKGCDLSELRSILKDMKSTTLNVIDAYFNSNDSDPTAAVLAAFDEYNKARKRFTNYGRCAIFRLSTKCNALVQHIRQLPYSSAENILTSMLRCATLKSQCNPAEATQVEDFTQGPTSTPDENCITIGARPNPQSQSECFSEEFSTTLRNFITDKYGMLEDTYNSTAEQCDYGELLQCIGEMKAIMYQLIDLVKNKSLTFAQFDKVFDTYPAARDAYSLGLRNFILNNDKSCYYNPRRGRLIPLFLTDAVFAALTKCIRYTDKSEDRCGCPKK